MFISYSQNNEDVILHRAFKDIKNGFYVDIGANDPSFRSVTKAFYDMGWNGINIEPDPIVFKKLYKERLRDINLNVGISTKKDKLMFYQFNNYERNGDTALSTLSQEIADHHKQKYNMDYQKIEIDTLPLNIILEQFSSKQIHFMNIDVEGWELEVLSSVNLIKYRPIIILIESLFPTVPIKTHTRWEHVLTSQGYEFVFFDGINRYYLAKEHASLSNYFDCPVNVFDNFKTIYVLELEKKVNLLEKELVK